MDGVRGGDTNLLGRAFQTVRSAASNTGIALGGLASRAVTALGGGIHSAIVWARDTVSRCWQSCTSCVRLDSRDVSDLGSSRSSGAQEMNASGTSAAGAATVQAVNTRFIMKTPDKAPLTRQIGEDAGGEAGKVAFHVLIIKPPKMEELEACRETILGIYFELQNNSMSIENATTALRSALHDVGKCAHKSSWTYIQAKGDIKALGTAAYVEIADWFGMSTNRKTMTGAALVEMCTQLVEIMAAEGVSRPTNQGPQPNASHQDTPAVQSMLAAEALEDAPAAPTVQDIQSMLAADAGNKLLKRQATTV